MVLMATKKSKSVSRKAAKPATLALIVLGFALVYVAASASILGGAAQLALGLISMFVIGLTIQRVNSLKGGYGGYIAGTSHGLTLVDRISRKWPKFWEAMSVWGIIVGLGLLSYPIMRKRVSFKMYAFGIASLIFIYLLVIPVATSAYQFINIPQVAAAAASRPAQTASAVMLIEAVFLVVSIVTGLSGFLFGFIAYNAASIVYSDILYLLSLLAGAPNSSNLTTQVPGVALILPGIGIPLVAGLIAFAILIIVHEFSHGILARIWKVKLKQMGLLLFGVIPIGAFVEPDEKEVSRLDAFRQMKIFSAGVASNFLIMMLFFVLVVAMQLYVMPFIYSNHVIIGAVVSNTPAYGVLKPGMWIQSWNGHQISNITSLTSAAATDTPGQMVTVVANGTPYSFNAISIGGSPHGIIGLANAYQPVSSATWVQVSYFLYIVFSLSLLFNFLVGAANLFPLPLFDGWRIYQAGVKSRRLVKLLGIILVIALVLNALPWFYI
jgi:membrane-associated protease RseP (regulator of RpoE activity)